MTVKLGSADYQYQGLSTDELPPGAPEGSTFHMVDTGEAWIMHDELWTLDLRVQQAWKEES